MEYCNYYKYLGVTISCHLDLELAINSLVDSAGRALSLIICKMIKAGGFAYNVYSTLMSACVNSITEYGGEVIGYKEYESSNKLYLRAARAFIGVSKNAPIPGIIAEICWLLPHYKRRLKMVKHYDKMLKLDNSRITKIVLLWDKYLNDNNIVHT